MNQIVGSAIKIIAEVDVVTGTTVTLKDLIGPDGSTILSDQSMSFDDTSNTLNATITWQSTLNTHVAGRYKYLVKAVNGAFTNIARAQFFLEDE